MNIDWPVVAEIFSPLLPTLQWPSLTTVLLFALLEYHGYFKYLKQFHFLMLPSKVSAWVVGLMLFFTNVDFLCLFVVVAWWVIEKTLREEAEQEAQAQQAQQAQ